MAHSHHTWLKFVRDYVDLASRLEEGIAGLIMVLGFTLIAGFTAASGKQGVRTLLLGALGCNTAWGIIDSALFAWGNLTDRRLQLRFLTNLRSAPNESEVFSAIGGRLNPLLEPEVGAEERARLCKAILPVMMRVQLPDPDLTKDDVNGMIAIFMVDVAAVIPAVIRNVTYNGSLSIGVVFSIDAFLVVLQRHLGINYKISLFGERYHDIWLTLVPIFMSKRLSKFIFMPFSQARCLKHAL